MKINKKDLINKFKDIVNNYDSEDEFGYQYGFQLIDRELSALSMVLNLQEVRENKKLDMIKLLSLEELRNMVDIKKKKENE